MLEYLPESLSYLPYFLSVLLPAAKNTVMVTVGALAVALALGMVIALLRISRLALFRIPARIYIEVMRGTPPITQLFIIYFGLPELGVDFDPLPAAIIGLGMNGAAYVAEIYRGGIVAIQKWQFETSLTLGLTPAATMRYVILPQAVRIVIPPLANYAISLLKDTAIIQTIAVPEIMFHARALVSETYLSMQIYLLVAMMYLSISIPMSRVANRLEQARRRWL